MADQLDTGRISWQQFFSYVLAILLAALALYVCRYFWRKQIYGGAAILEKELRGRLFWHFMQMDRTFFQRYRTGDLMARATNDVQAVQNVAGDGILTLIDAIFTGGTTLLAMMILVDWRLTLVAMLPLPLWPSVPATWVIACMTPIWIRRRPFPLEQQDSGILVWD